MAVLGHVTKVVPNKAIKTRISQTAACVGRRCDPCCCRHHAFSTAARWCGGGGASRALLREVSAALARSSAHTRTGTPAAPATRNRTPPCLDLPPPLHPWSTGPRPACLRRAATSFTARTTNAACCAPTARPSSLATPLPSHPARVTWPHTTDLTASLLRPSMRRAPSRAALASFARA